MTVCVAARRPCRARYTAAIATQMAPMECGEARYRKNPDQSEWSVKYADPNVPMAVVSPNAAETAAERTGSRIGAGIASHQAYSRANGFTE